MIQVEIEYVKQALKQFSHITLHKDLVELGTIKKCEVVNHVLSIHLVMPFVWHDAYQTLKNELTPLFLTQTTINRVNWSIDYHVATLKRANDKSGIKNVKNIIAISSGKGGVGKSSTAVNLALALQKQGAKVGLLDADIYGPSIPMMLGALDEHPTSPDNQHMYPIMAHGLATNSIGYLVPQQDATIWRGPMASKALLQVLNDTLWTELDYLIIDMPPGTGDIQLTLAQSIPVTGAIIVTTPQDIALVDAKKGIAMFNKVNIPIIGIIENMSYHICENCGYHEAIFGKKGAEMLAKQYQSLLLGQIPLHRSLCEDLDKGRPTVIEQPNSEFSRLYRQLAERASAELYWQREVILPDIAIKNL